MSVEMRYNRSFGILTVISVLSTVRLGHVALIWSTGSPLKSDAISLSISRVAAHVALSLPHIRVPAEHQSAVHFIQPVLLDRQIPGRLLLRRHRAQYPLRDLVRRLALRPLGRIQAITVHHQTGN